MVTLGDYLIVSGVLFTIGFAGVMVRRNIIIILMALELMLNAANLSLVAFSRFRLTSGAPSYNTQVFVFFIITGGLVQLAQGWHAVNKATSDKPWTIDSIEGVRDKLFKGVETGVPPFAL